MDGDGHLDMITGHYWPGDIFLFRGEGENRFAAMENLKDETGRNLNGGAPWDDDKTPRMESLAAAPYATDFDGDGDYDMLIGNIRGSITYMENVGGPKEPRFSTERTLLEAGGETIKVPGGDAGPVFEDWNKDGKRDLLSGAGDGSVWFFKNVGADDAPHFAEGVELLEKSSQGWKSYPHGGAPKGPGMRTKVCVTDVDGDGWVDLLVGDYVQEEPAPIELTEEQAARLEELKEERDRVREELTAAGDDEEASAKIAERYGKIYEEIRELEPPDIPHGFVWYYRRVPPKDDAVGAVIR